MFMQNIKLILDEINKDLSNLDEIIQKSVKLKKSYNLPNIKQFNKETITQISNNLDKLDNIIKKLDEDS